MIAFATTFTGFGFFLLHQNAGVTKGLIITYAAMFVVMVFFTWLVNKAASNSGVLQLPKGKMRLLGASPVISYVFYAALTACMIASIIFGATFAYYCIYVAAGALFVSACYYTIRLG